MSYWIAYTIDNDKKYYLSFKKTTGNKEYYYLQDNISKSLKYHTPNDALNDIAFFQSHQDNHKLHFEIIELN